MKPKPKPKAKPANKISAVCDDMLKPRRSIPIAEVDEMIQQAVNRVKSQRTIFDDRNDLLEHLAQTERNLEDYEHIVHSYRKQIQTGQAQLKEINTAIKRELELGE